MTRGVLAVEERVREPVHGARAGEIRAHQRCVDSGEGGFIGAEMRGDRRDEGGVSVRVGVTKQAGATLGGFVADEAEAVGVFFTPSQIYADEEHGAVRGG
jgi:hypothetical protein